MLALLLLFRPARTGVSASLARLLSDAPPSDTLVWMRTELPPPRTANKVANHNLAMVDYKTLYRRTRWEEITDNTRNTT